MLCFPGTQSGGGEKTPKAQFRVERGILETGIGGTLQLTTADQPTFLQNPVQHQRKASQPLQVKTVKSGEGCLCSSPSPPCGLLGWVP